MNQQLSNLRLPEQNTVILIGRLTRDPDLRRTNSGKAICVFDIALGRRIKNIVSGEWIDADPTFVPIVVWGEQAERCSERLKKGHAVCINGRLNTNKWENNDGIKKSRLEVIALRIQFLSILKDNVGKKTDKNESKILIEEEDDDDTNVPF
ncbi:MAG: single-stranded DNA-binding protein [Endomicrobium sp.]|jgi:single-strand DNA-binding protein|nr:single-stranded DNA-binding protein [Endomicrobium sp.]